MAIVNDKVKKSLSMSLKTGKDLSTLCAHLGVNEHSYMVNEIAKAVQRDSIALVSAEQSKDALVQMLEMMKSTE